MPTETKARAINNQKLKGSFNIKLLINTPKMGVKKEKADKLVTG